MVMLPGPEPKGAAQQRERRRFARDVGDEHGLAWAHEPRRRKGKFTVGSALVLAVFATAGALPLLLADGDGQLVAPNCDQLAVEVGPQQVSAGRDFAWQVAGPETGPYVVAIGSRTVTGSTAGPVTVDTGRVLSGPTALPGCRSPQTVTEGPAEPGNYEVTLFRRNGSAWERASVAFLEVS